MDGAAHANDKARTANRQSPDEGTARVTMDTCAAPTLGVHSKMKSAIGAKEELEASLSENEHSREVANVVFVFAQGLEEFLQAFDIDI